jgi:glycosyltransferase EpsE
MCDDCSSDNTYEVALKLAEKDSRIIVLKNEKNLTLAPTLNKCESVAKGKYLARMDGDDVCALDRFQKEYDFLEQHPEYAVVSCNMILYDDEGEHGFIKYTEKPNGQLLMRGSQFCHAGCMMRKEVFDELGGYGETADVERIEDFNLWFRLYKAGYKGYNIQESLYSMRDDRNAFSRRKIKYRINEAKQIKQIASVFGVGINSKLMFLVPLIKGIIPSFVYKYFHNKKARN